jgi:tight adherence protein C
MKERLKRVAPLLDTPGLGYAYEESRSPLYVFCGNLLTAFGLDLAAAKRDLYILMARAGLMSSDGVVYYLFFKRFMQPLFLLAGALLFLRLMSLEGAPLTIKLLYIIIGGVLMIIGVAGANLYLKNRTDKRKTVLERSFPDALDLMLVCVESGLPLDSALARVCREMKKAHPDITQELDRTRIELNVLNDRALALHNLADRTDTRGFRTLVSTLVQTEKVGSSIADTLRMLADEYRTTRMLTAENKAARIPVLITIPLIGCILLPFLLGIIMGPAVLKVRAQGGLFGENK